MSFAKRILWGVQAARGRLDGLAATVDDLQAQLDEARRIEKILRTAIEKTQLERSYWYELWFAEGRQYQAAQQALMQEINALRVKLGVKDADKLAELEKLAERQREALFVNPAKHPTPAIKTELTHVECPPVNHSSELEKVDE